MYWEANLLLTKVESTLALVMLNEMMRLVLFRLRSEEDNSICIWHLRQHSLRSGQGV